MEFKKPNTDVRRSQIIFLYDSSWDQPNGDPMTGLPRYDVSSELALVSDVRIKRYIRDGIEMIMDNQEIYVKEPGSAILEEEIEEGTEEAKKSGSAARIQQLALKFLEPEVVKALFKKGKDEKKSKINVEENIRELLLKCLDVRLFGAVATVKRSAVNMAGPIQFNRLNFSLNKITLWQDQNTCVFPSDSRNQAGTIGTTMIVPWGLIQIIGSTNPALAELTGLKEEEVCSALKVLWMAINVFKTRSKNGTSRLMLKINMADPYSYIPDIANKIKIKADQDHKDEYSLRNIAQVTMDYSKLLEALKPEIVESIQYCVEDSMVNDFLLQMEPVKSKLIKLI